MPLYSRPRILVADASDGRRSELRAILEKHDFRVTEARDASDAVAAAHREHPDVALVDSGLGDPDGYELCRQLKGDPETSRIPVLQLLRPCATPSERARALECGADNYVGAPVELEELLAAIRSALRARSAEESARALAREWQTTFDAIGDGVAVVDLENRIRRANASWMRLLRRSDGECVGRVASELWRGVKEQDRPFAQAVKRRGRESMEFDYEGRRLRLTVDPIVDETGAAAGAVHIVSDITETRRLEEQFRESQKFETIGTLAAGVAHDFNNLLTSILGNASLVAAEMPGDSPQAERLEDIVRSGERAADLTRQLLAYSGKGRHYLQKVDVSALTRRIQGLIESAVPKMVRVELELEARLPAVEADANQVQQLILNLVSNAAEAIGEAAGTIAIRTSAEGGRVKLEVQDTGCGMDAETRSKIFDPFFTTKFTGRGLGLAAVAGIARMHRAEVEVVSAPGKGSTFRVWFPAVEAADTAVAMPSREGREAVLVVDDEEMVRRIARASLESRGHKVLLAGNGLEAIEAVRAHPDIGVVLLDLTMPVMGGEEALEEMLRERPGIQVIVSTGYGQREAVARFSQKAVAGFLQKPYTSRQLVDKVKAVLRRR